MCVRHNPSGWATGWLIPWACAGGSRRLEGGCRRRAFAPSLVVRGAVVVAVHRRLVRFRHRRHGALQKPLFSVFCNCRSYHTSGRFSSASCSPSPRLRLALRPGRLLQPHAREAQSRTFPSYQLLSLPPLACDSSVFGDSLFLSLTLERHTHLPPPSSPPYTPSSPRLRLLRVLGDSLCLRLFRLERHPPTPTCTSSPFHPPSPRLRLLRVLGDSSLCLRLLRLGRLTPLETPPRLGRLTLLETLPS